MQLAFGADAASECRGPSLCSGWRARFRRQPATHYPCKRRPQFEKWGPRPVTRFRRSPTP